MLVRSVMTITEVLWRRDPDHRVMCRRSHRANVESRYFAMRQVDEIKGQQAMDTDVFSQAELSQQILTFDIPDEALAHEFSVCFVGGQARNNNVDADLKARSR